MDTSHEGRDREAVRGRHVAKVSRLEQRKIALLRILARLQTFAANDVEARSRQDDR
jgi:hypothetical protein